MAKNKKTPVPPPPPPPPSPKKYSTNIYCPNGLKPEFGEAAANLQALLKKDVWFLAEGPDFALTLWMYYRLRDKKAEVAGRDVALVVDSFGGMALAAYRIATFFQRHAKSFTVVVPRIAKSAATLLALGASEIILGDDAELGPLDVQLYDYDVHEDRVSALDMVQAIEQLEESAIDVAMRMLKSLKEKTKKRANLLLEPSLRFAAEVTKPLFEKIDSVSYSRHNRMLREAEEYAVRLLLKGGSERAEAEAIARDMVKLYPTHEFVIDLDECKRIGIIRNDDGKETRRVGLRAIGPATPGINSALESLYNSIGNTCALGKLVEIQKK